MSYIILMTPSANKMLKKLPKQVREYIVTSTIPLQDNPFLGQQLHGEFRKFFSFHLKFRNVHYRLGYEIGEGKKQIIIRAAGVRENFYKQLKEMKIKPLS